MIITRENYEIWFLDYAEGKLTTEQVAVLFRFIEKNPDLKEELESFEIISLEPLDDPFPGKNELHRSSLGLNNANHEEFFISYSEGILDENEKKEVEKYAASSPALLHELNAFLAVKLPEEKAAMDEIYFLRKGNFEFNPSEKEFWIVSFIENQLSAEQKKVFIRILNSDPTLAEEVQQYRKTMLNPDHSVVFSDKESLKKEAGIRKMHIVRYLSYAAAACLLLFFLLPSGETIMENNLAQIEPVNENNRKSATDENSIPTKENPESNNIVITPSENENIKQADIPPHSMQYEKVELVPAIEPQLLSASSSSGIITDNFSVTDLSTPDLNPDMAINSSKNNNFITPVQFLKKTFNKKVFGEEEAADETIASSKTEKSTRIGDLPVKILSEKQENYYAYGFSVGGFSFSRTTHK